MKTDTEIKQWAEDQGLLFIIPDGYPEAFVGATNRGESARAVYDLEKVLKVLMERDGMDRVEALEFFDFNVEGGGHPENGPIYIQVPPR